MLTEGLITDFHLAYSVMLPVEPEGIEVTLDPVNPELLYQPMKVLLLNTGAARVMLPVSIVYEAGLLLFAPSAPT